MRLVRPAALLAALTLAACGSPDPAALDRNQLERIAAEENRAEPVDPTVLLQPLDDGDVAAAGLQGERCAFRSAEGARLLAAAGDAAVARIGGDVVHLVASGPVGPSGGFFEERQASVSVGRSRAPDDEAAGVNWPARATVTNRRSGVQRDYRGSWACG